MREGSVRKEVRKVREMGIAEEVGSKGSRGGVT